MCKKEDRREYINNKGISPLSLPRNMNAKCLGQRPLPRFIWPYDYEENFYSTTNVREILGVFRICQHFACRPWESIRSGSSRKDLRSFSGVCCSHPDVTCRQVVVFQRCSRVGTAPPQFYWVWKRVPQLFLIVTWLEVVCFYSDFLCAAAHAA